MRLAGKTKEQIREAIRDLNKDQLAELIHRLVTFEPMFTLKEISERRRISRDTLLKLIHQGVLPAHKPVENGIRISLSDLQEWDRQTAIAVRT